ncbi:S-DNA-T family DNA segregation ATPase FtsK/SpoIIIE [Phycicoccus badiiscoriae]|uniref:S-DNA-T family DNA segregation ATPase FtsK/SpoIIIE n=1 Tax=Pedococcus badiiscoriae TaxID=642776 RepID=A0A852WJD8_9MICO|nr:FtsK/SpoIIIE domain-containing protein [Pedococcus badiiscoriae]NYG07741.1 S-DNA-T family DNA segregation ATPase FtsK/SpoIIIE [Pedococcus badiiscoriae]
MRLQLTVVQLSSAPARSGPCPLEIEVEAPAGSTSRELARALADLVVRGGHHELRDPVLAVGGAAVADDAPVGRHPLVDGAALTLATRHQVRPPPSPSHPRTPLTLAVAHGPDAGRTIDLPPGVYTLGRSDEATVSLDDERMSRIHARITVTGEGLTLADLGSTNGTRLDGARVGADPQSLRVGSTVQAGDTMLAIRQAGEVPAALSPRPDGTTTVNRRPRLLSPPIPVTIVLPSPPVQPGRSRPPWIAMLLPVPFAAALAVFFGPMMLAFAVMSPLVLAGTALGDRVGSKRRYAAEHAAYEGHLGAARERVAAACEEESRSLRRSLPDPCEILAITTLPSARLWERRRGDPDSLMVSIGRCTRPATVRVVRPSADAAAGQDPGDDVERPALERVPCAVAWADIGVLGVCGERRAALGVARSVLGQLAALHSPLDLELVLVTGSTHADPSWAWLARLPHVRRPDGHPRHQWVTSLDGDTPAAPAVVDLAHRVRARRAASSSAAAPWRGPQTVVVLDGACALRRLPDLAEVLEHGPSVGICVLALDPDRAGLPSEVAAILDLTRPAHPSFHAPGRVTTDLAVDGVAGWWADRLSRALAPLRDATPGSQESSLPTTVCLTELWGRGPGDRASTEGQSLDAAAVVRTWERTPHCTAVPVGVTPDGPFVVDLAADGPHVLVAGTTGAGKSELLRSLVASLALHNRPEHLALVLIDYKGGAALRECAGLPHVAGVVTDLDEHLADRALVSLMAELKRRERSFADAGVPDFVAYQSSSTCRAAPLARLVIVVDEFRALTEELPQFIDGMVRVAALGRSLGVNLVLATQRPAGVVTADIKANVNLRIALRVRDRTDSEDVIDAPDAAGLDRGVPGRGYARTGGGPLVSFQGAHASGTSHPRERPGIRVRMAAWDQPPTPWPEAPGMHPAAVSDLVEVVEVVAAAADLLDTRQAPSPWLPPLPTRVDGKSLPAPSAGRIPIGLTDEPQAQRQRPLEVDLAGSGHWAFVGAVGSGRSSALRTVVLGAVAALDAIRLHVYAVSGGSLADLEALPHCGAHVGWDDLPRLERLVQRLATEVAARRRRLAASPHPTMADWWRASDDVAPPRLLVVVDDWDALAGRADEATHGALVERLLRLLREGVGVGLTAVLAGDRALLVGRAASTLSHRVLLRLADRTDLLLAGLPVKAVPATQPPGRGVLADGTEVQLALPPRRITHHPAPQSRRESAAESDDGTPPDRRPWRVDALPSRVEARSLPTSSGDEDLVSLGLGGDELGVLGLSAPRDGRRWIVAGSNGSGVSSTLVVIAAQLLAQDRQLAVVAARPGPWIALRHDARVLWCDDPTKPDALVATRRAVPDLAVLVDDADELLDSAVEATVAHVSAMVDRDGGLVVAGADAGALSAQYRGLAVELARHRTGVLLGPASSVEAEVFGVRVPLDPGAIPGRGYLVRGAVATPLQVAVATPDRPLNA